MTWPSSFNSGTLGYLKDRIADELGQRDDLTTQIAAAVNDAILMYQPDRLRFNVSYQATFNTVAGTQAYTAITDAQFPALASPQQIHAIDRVLATVGNMPYELDNVPPAEIIVRSAAGTFRGQPQAFAFANERLLFHPIPDNAYPITVFGAVTYRAPQSDSEASNRWMTDGEWLIRSRAKYQLAVHVIDDPVLAARMSPESPQPGQRAGESYLAFEALKGEANRIASTGRVRPMTF